MHIKLPVNLLPNNSKSVNDINDPILDGMVPKYMQSANIHLECILIDHINYYQTNASNST